MSNVIAAKAFQAKYRDCTSIWKEYGILIDQGDSIEDRTFSDMVPKCKPMRNASIVLIDGIKLLNEKGIREIGLKKNEVRVLFDSTEVNKLNNKVEDLLRIVELATNYEVRLNWVASTSDDEVTEFGDYYTTSASRGKTTQGQGAVDFLTVSALFGEALRNLLFDRVKNKISLVVLERFIAYRRFMLQHSRRILNNSLTDPEKETFRHMIIALGDALYMSGSYYKTDSSFVKRHMETKQLFGFKASLPVNDEVLGADIFNPDYLEKLVKAYI